MNAYQKLALERGWNDLQIAEYTGLPRSTVRNWLNGTRAPGAAAVRLVEVLSEHNNWCPLCGTTHAAGSGPQGYSCAS